MGASGDERPLADLRVVVTRPDHQAEPLCRRLEAAGATALRFPGLTIEPAADVAAARARLEAMAEFDRIVFVSANAVWCAARMLGGDLPELAGRYAAVGAATARALEGAGRPPSLVPDDHRSEGLLALPELRDVSGRRVLIVRGEGGRELLAETLRARGAEVDYAEVYRRGRPAPDAAAIRRVWVDHGGPSVVTATSPDILDNLVALLDRDPARAALLGAQLVVVSERMVKQARALGFRRPALLARGPGDDALVDAVAEWRSG